MKQNFSPAKKIVGGLKKILKKIIGLLIIVLVLAFVGYHFYSVGSLVKNFKSTTGLQSPAPSKTK